MRLNRSPGLDGLSVEFYRTFWDELKEFIVNTLNHSYEKGEMTNTQKVGLISLIHKKGDPLLLDNYRPITLLNVDTKLLAYSIAQRIKNILPKIISTDQNGYVKNRYIGYNIRQIQDIIDYSEQFKVDGAILFLDFSKAFDSLEWKFMFESLKKFGFQESMIKWIKVMYTDIKSSVTNNGWISAPVAVHRGIRQGCPCSALIFVIAVEILACKIRQDNSIKGFCIKLDGKNHCLKISQLADDTTLFLKTKQEITKALNLIEIFGALSGLKLNRSKTEGIWLGALKHCREKFENINWTDTPVKSLGIYFGRNAGECKKLNFDKQYDKSEKLLNNWTKRNLTIIGKITVVKSLILPNLTFLASVTHIDKSNIDKFNTLIYKFIWNNKPSKVKRSILCQDILCGGLKMINIEKYIDAIKLTWVKRLLSKEHANWKIIPNHFFNLMGANFLIFYMNSDNIKSIPNSNLLPEFYYELTRTLIKYRNTDKDIPNEFRTIRQQIIWGNKHIKLKGKSLIFKNWIDSNIKYINDIIDEEGNISENLIYTKLKARSNWISEISQIKKALPKSWINILKRNDSRKTKVRTVSEIKIKSHIINKLSTKTLYSLLTEDDTELPIGFSKWMRILNNEDLKHTAKYTLKFIHQNLVENKHKMMRWKLLHNILPCKTLLKQWKICDNSVCNYCNEIENYEHYFLKCKYFKDLWGKIYEITEKIGYNRNIFSLKNMIWGYKVKYTEYGEINYFMTIILFAIYKAYCASEQKTQPVNVKCIFKNEVHNSIFLYKVVSKKKSSLLYQIQNLV